MPSRCIAASYRLAKKASQARGDTILWNGWTLKTNVASSRALSVDVPPSLLEAPGEVDVTVEDTLDPARSTLHASSSGHEAMPPSSLIPRFILRSSCSS